MANIKLKPSEERRLKETPKPPRPVSEFASVRLADMDSGINPKVYVLKNSGRLLRVMSFFLLTFFLFSCAQTESEKKISLFQTQMNEDPSTWWEYRDFYPYKKVGGETISFVFKPTHVVADLHGNQRVIPGSWGTIMPNAFTSEDHLDSLVVYPDLLMWYKLDSTNNIVRDIYLSTIHYHKDYKNEPAK